METSNHSIGPAIFFCVKGKVLFHTCSLESAESYGDFLNYPYSHHKIWQKYYEFKYHVDFDYYPRGRVIDRKSDNTFLIYYDKCMKSVVKSITQRYECQTAELHYDEHYQCHMCNKEYVE